jgi:hypothetical protein
MNSRWRLKNLSDSELERIVSNSARALREAQEELQRREDQEKQAIKILSSVVITGR